jgi:hypothetical protein
VTKKPLPDFCSPCNWSTAGFASAASPRSTLTGQARRQILGLRSPRSELRKIALGCGVRSLGK